MKIAAAKSSKRVLRIVVQFIRLRILSIGISECGLLVLRMAPLDGPIGAKFNPQSASEICN
jgi:hypothetical protein